MPIRRLRSAWRSFVLLFAIAVPQTVLAQPAFLVKDINTTGPTTEEQPIPSSLASSFGFFSYGQDDFEEHGGKLLFAAAADAVQWRQLWVSDGTPAGTFMVEETSNAFALGELTSTVGGPTFFRTYTDLYKTDGTPEGTESLWSDSTPLPSNLVAFGSSIFYRCSVPAGELCKSDGTPEGTGLVKDVQPPGVFFHIARLTMSGSTLFFVADDGTSGRELFKSDGTEAGTTLVHDLWTGGESVPELLTDVNGTLFFSGFHPDTGRELWKSDGTAAGTVLVKDVRPGGASSFPEQIGTGTGFFTAAVGSNLFFLADDGTSGSELWKSDGTTAGTVRVKDIAPGPEGSSPSWFARLGNRVYFTAYDGEHGRELWVSDGTEAGTRMVADLFPGEGSSLPQHLEAVGHVLLFSATDGVHGVEMWRSNGTAAGTRRIQDIAPGGLSSNPHKFTSAGSLVFFAANDQATGNELWAVPRSEVLATFSDVPANSSVWPFVEVLAGAGITAGCAPGRFCPWGNVNRSEIAVFLLRGTRGPGFVPPPATGTVFADVPAGYWAASWIEQFSLDGFTSGCGTAPLRYCPAQELSRAEMAIFLLRAKHGSAYTPPAATGTVFTDVPANHWAASWIEQLAAEGVTAGCAPGLYCPGDLVTRAQMAIFLTRTFSLSLP